MTSSIDDLTAAEAVCARFLYHEAEALDDRRLDDWLALLAPDIDYRIPTRVTREAGAAHSEFSDASYLMIETFATLATRVRRFSTGYAFAEDPPTRTRRLVGNVRVAGDPLATELAVRSNLLLFRAKFDMAPALVAAERHDVIRRTAGGPRLVRRVVRLDHTELPMENLAVFL